MASTSWLSPDAPSTEFVVEAELRNQLTESNGSIVRIHLESYNRGNTSSAFSGAGVHAAYARNRLGQVLDAGQYAANPFLPSGYGTGARRWRAGPFDVFVPHLEDGRAPVAMSGGRRGIAIGQNIVYGVYDVAVELVLEVPAIVRSIIRVGVDDDWVDHLAYAGINGSWVPCIAHAGVDDAWTPLALT